MASRAPITSPRHLPAILLAAVASLLVGCSADDPLNTSFALTLDDARLAMREMRNDRRLYPRPVVVVAGIYDPGVAAALTADRFRRLGIDRDQVISVAFFGLGTFDRCRDRLIDRVDDAFPDDDPVWTTEIDVVGISMGGLVARYAAAPRTDDGRRLRIRRLFTISTPHRGASLAGLPTFDRRVIDMRAGSAFLDTLNAQLTDARYEIVPYARLDDLVVGEENAAPPGRDPWWVANIPGSFSHMFACDDPRILADIARRLRNETPYTASPPAPLPGAGSHAPVAAN